MRARSRVGLGDPQHISARMKNFIVNSKHAGMRGRKGVRRQNFQGCTFHPPTMNYVPGIRYGTMGEV